MGTVVDCQEFAALRGGARDDVLAGVLRSSMRAFAEAADLVHAATGARSYRDDLHRDARAWVRAVWNCSTDDASLLVATGRLMAELPALAVAVRDGLVSFAHLRELVRLHRNPRAGHLLAEVDDVLAQCAVTLRFPDFVTMCRHWEALADPDGSHADFANEREHRNVSLINDRHGFRLRAKGDALAGATIGEVLDAFAEAELLADMAWLRETHGPDAPTCLLPRSHAQRRADALTRIFHCAGGAPDAPGVEIVVNVTVDEATLRDAAASRKPPTPLDPQFLQRWAQRRCQTDTGVQLDSFDVMWAAMLGRVRFVQTTADGNVTGISSRQRCFTGGARDAVFIAHGRCCRLPGCLVHGRSVQADHIRPHSHGGPTDSDNGGPGCGSHNRGAYTAGIRTWRDPNGQWHHYRPDGTEIAPRPEWVTRQARRRATRPPPEPDG